MDDIKYQKVPLFKLEKKNDLEASGCFLSSGSYFLKIMNDGKILGMQ
jgi:hypothetical protein